MNLKETEKENDQKWVRKRHTELKQYSIHSFNGLEHKTSIVLYLQNPWYNRFANLKLKSKYLSTENKFYSILIDLDEIKKQNDLMYPCHKYTNQRVTVPLTSSITTNKPLMVCKPFFWFMRTIIEKSTPSRRLISPPSASKNRKRTNVNVNVEQMIFYKDN